MSIIVTGSEGVIGRLVVPELEKTQGVIKIDKTLGHNLEVEIETKELFKQHPNARYLVNLFAINDHIDQEELNNLFDVPLQSINEYLYVNLTTLFSVCREFARTRTSGSIINFSSTYGIVSPFPELYENKRHKHVGYCISKAGVLQLTRYLAVHLAPHFRVNSVVPGGVFDNQEENFIKRYSGNTPLGRMMDGTELTGILKYLCSEESSYTTGASLVVDGGWTIR